MVGYGRIACTQRKFAECRRGSSCHEAGLHCGSFLKTAVPHALCARVLHFYLLPAYGLWEKCSDLSESQAFGSSSPDMTKVWFVKGHRHILENGIYSYVFAAFSTKPRRSWNIAFLRPAFATDSALV